MKTLSKNKDLIVCKPDKGKGVVLINRKDYVNSITKIISDNTKFEIITDSIEKYTLKIEDKINNFLRKLKDSTVVF